MKGTTTKLEPGWPDGDAVSAHGTQRRRTGYEEVIVVVDGQVEIECDGETYALDAGDMIVYDCPIDPKRLRSAGFPAAHIIRHRYKGTRNE
jgi:mannose-6-phosphate isomerase-like protein (cupin superfamily)